ncbi:MAG: amino acid permease [Vampirovibrionales bacterium]
MMMSLFCKLFQRKSLDQILNETENQEHKLEKTLSAFDLVVFGVGAMVGAGIFVLTGAAAAGSGSHLAAGPALMLSFLLTAAVCGVCALCYAEFAAMIPISGSAYSYAFAALGELVAWVIGWALVLEYVVGNMAVAVGWTGSVKEFLAIFGIHNIPQWMLKNTFDTVTQANLAHVDTASLLTHPIALNFMGHDTPMYLLVQKGFNLPACLILLATTALLYRGVQESKFTTTLMVFVKTSVILLFIATGLYFLGVNPQMVHTHWLAEGWKTFAPNGFNGILAGASTIFYAYIGFDAVSCAAEETKNPQKDIPIGIIGSLIICTLLYIAVTAVITGAVPLNLINKEAAVVGVMNQMGYTWASVLVSVGAIAGLTSVLLVLQMAGVRVFYAIARDGLLPKPLAVLHPVYKTPHICTVLVGLFAAIGAGFLPINMLAEMCNIGTLGAFMIVCAGIAILRFTDPQRERPFKTPGGILLPLVGIAGCAYVMTGLPTLTWLTAGIWFLVGLVIYFSYGIKHSKLRQLTPSVPSMSGLPHTHTKGEGHHEAVSQKVAANEQEAVSMLS